MTPLDILRENLTALEKEHGRFSEKLLFELSELADVICERVKSDPYGEETAELFRRSRSLFPSSCLQDDGTPSAYFSALRARGESSYSVSLAVFSIFLSERLRSEKSVGLPWEEKHTSARIAYVPAGSAERAYFALAAMREDASVSYVGSTREAAEAVSARTTDYAMLPYMSADGEILPAVSKLLRQNDLSLSALVHVPHGEGRLAYALLSSELSPFVHLDKMALSLRLTAGSFAHLGQMLAALALMGYTQTELIPEREEYGRVCAVITLMGEGDALALWLYLSLYSVGFSFLGRYPVIEL